MRRAGISRTSFRSSVAFFRISAGYSRLPSVSGSAPPEGPRPGGADSRGSTSPAGSGPIHSWSCTTRIPGAIWLSGTAVDYAWTGHNDLRASSTTLKGSHARLRMATEIRVPLGAREQVHQRGGDLDAGAGHRRHHGRLQHRVRRPAAAAALPGI